MKPNCPGIYEWYDDRGKKRLVEVVDTEIYPGFPPHLRVYWWGGYYNVNDDPQTKFGDPFRKSEWPDSWGNRICDNNGLAEDQLYLFPDAEDMKRFKPEDYV